MLGVHRFLGALAVVFVLVHVLAIVADNYTSFGLADVLVPFASAWKPIPVALGIVGIYILVAVEITSLLQRHLPRTVWRQIHLASYGLFAFATAPRAVGRHRRPIGGGRRARHRRRRGGGAVPRALVGVAGRAPSRREWPAASRRSVSR